jgi:DNA polymerase III subunit beta
MITLPRAELATELALLSTVIEVKGTMPILAYVKIEARGGTATLTATRVDATLTVGVPCEGEDEGYCLPLVPLREAVRLTPDERIKFQRKDNRIEVTAGRSRHRLPVEEVAAFPQVADVTGQTLQVDAPRLLDAVERVGPCVDRQQGRYATQGVCIEAAEGELNVIAFDGTQSGIVRLMDTKLTFQSTVPSVAIPALRAVLGDRPSATLTISENSLLVECEGRRMIARLLLGTFPHWRMIVPVSCPHVVTLTGEVRDAIRRCCVTASEGNLVRRRLKLEFGREVLTVRSYGGDGESVEEVSVGCATLNGEALVVKVNADQVLAFLSQVEGPELKLKDVTTILLFTAGEQRYLHATLRPDA